jgi:folate-binding protein YgfZ
MNDPRFTTTPSEEIEFGYELLRLTCGLVREDRLILVEMTGEDRRAWLQGQVTNDLRSLDPGSAAAFCLTTPTGQLEAVCRVWALPDRFIISLHEAELAALMRRVERRVIMEDVAARKLDGILLNLQGPTATRTLQRVVSPPSMEAATGHINGNEVIFMRSNRTGAGGWKIFVPQGAEGAERMLSDLAPPVAPEAYDVARLEAGIPLPGRDYDERTLPPELGPAFEALTVSYTKGCYTGQEVLMRIHSRGHTNRTWMGILAERPLAAGDLVRHPARPDAGQITSAGISPGLGPIAGAMVRREAARPGEAVIIETTEGPVEAELRHMPLWTP